MIDIERKRGAETQAEGEAASTQGARCGIRSQDSRTTPQAEGRPQTAEPPTDPPNINKILFKILGHIKEKALLSL